MTLTNILLIMLGYAFFFFFLLPPACLLTASKQSLFKEPPKKYESKESWRVLFPLIRDIITISLKFCRAGKSIEIFKLKFFFSVVKHHFDFTQHICYFIVYYSFSLGPHPCPLLTLN